MLAPGGGGKGFEDAAVIRCVARRLRESEGCRPVISRKSASDAVFLVFVLKHIGRQATRMDAGQIGVYSANGGVARTSVPHRFDVIEHALPRTVTRSKGFGNKPWPAVTQCTCRRRAQGGIGCLPTLPCAPFYRAKPVAQRIDRRPQARRLTMQSLGQRGTFPFSGGVGQEPLVTVATVVRQSAIIFPDARRHAVEIGLKNIALSGVSDGGRDHRRFGKLPKRSRARSRDSRQHDGYRSKGDPRCALRAPLDRHFHRNGSSPGFVFQYRQRVAGTEYRTNEIESATGHKRLVSFMPILRESIMKLEGSCHCGAVHFSVESDTPYPYNRCYCSICRKTAGGGGYAINIMGRAETLKITGEENLSVYRSARNDRDSYEEDGLSPAKRYFCKSCGSALWVHGSDWPDFVYPFASAMDTPLPEAPETTHLMLGSKASWVSVNAAEHDAKFDEYPDTGIESWHRQRGLFGNI